MKPHVYVDVSQTIRVCFWIFSSAFKGAIQIWPQLFRYGFWLMRTRLLRLISPFYNRISNKTHIHSKTFKSTQWKIRTGKEIILSSISWHLWGHCKQSLVLYLSFKPNGGYGFIGLLVKKVGHHKQDTIIIPWVAGLWPRQARRWWICVPR